MQIKKAKYTDELDTNEAFIVSDIDFDTVKKIDLSEMNIPNLNFVKNCISLEKFRIEEVKISNQTIDEKFFPNTVKEVYLEDIGKVCIHKNFIKNLNKLKRFGFEYYPFSKEYSLDYFKFFDSEIHPPDPYESIKYEPKDYCVNLDELVFPKSIKILDINTHLPFYGSFKFLEKLTDLQILSLKIAEVKEHQNLFAGVVREYDKVVLPESIEILQIKAGSHDLLNFITTKNDEIKILEIEYTDEIKNINVPFKYIETIEITDSDHHVFDNVENLRFLEKLNFKFLGMRPEILQYADFLNIDLDKIYEI